MSDLIDRRAAIDAIIEDKICDDLLKIMIALGHGNKAETLNMTCDRHAKMLMSLPSAEPEIIRCKDCKDYQTDWETSCPNRHYCATVDLTMPEDGFCSFAERRADE